MHDIGKEPYGIKNVFCLLCLRLGRHGTVEGGRRRLIIPQLPAVPRAAVTADAAVAAAAPSGTPWPFPVTMPAFVDLFERAVGAAAAGSAVAARGEPSCCATVLSAAAVFVAVLQSPRGSRCPAEPLPTPGVAAANPAVVAAAAAAHLCGHASSHARNDSFDNVLRGVAVKNAAVGLYWRAVAAAFCFQLRCCCGYCWRCYSYCCCPGICWCCCC